MTKRTSWCACTVLSMISVIVIICRMWGESLNTPSWLICSLPTVISSLFFFFSSAWRRLQARYHRKSQHGQQKLQNFLWAKQVLWKSYGSGTLESAYERAQTLASGWRHTFMDKLKEVNKVSENWTAIGSTTCRRTDKICSLNLTGVIACLK